MIQTIQVLRFHLLELEKVLYLICSSEIEGIEKKKHRFIRDQSDIITIICFFCRHLSRKRKINLNQQLCFRLFSEKISETFFLHPLTDLSDR